MQHFSTLTFKSFSHAWLSHTSLFVVLTSKHLDNIRVSCSSPPDELRQGPPPERAPKPQVATRPQNRNQGMVQGMVQLFPNMAPVDSLAIRNVKLKKTGNAAAARTIFDNAAATTSSSPVEFNNNNNINSKPVFNPGARKASEPTLNLTSSRPGWLKVIRAEIVFLRPYLDLGISKQLTHN